MEAASGVETLRAGTLMVRPAEFAAFAHGQPLALTARELDVLSALAGRPRRIVTREELFVGYRFEAAPLHPFNKPATGR